MTTDARTVSRQAAVGGMGLAGVAGVAAALSAATPAHAQEPASMQVTTLAELRAATTADTGASYYVTDLGQEGPFRYDATDTSSADNTGTVVVSGAGHRFKRVIGGELRLSWFGAKADYNPRTGNGTPADNALELALGALQAFSALAPLNRGSRRGLPTIVFDAGNYVFRQPGHLVQWATGITGLHLEGQGIYQSNVYLDMDQAVHGAENHFLVNDGTDTANLGVVNNYSVDGLTFFGVTGTERFMRYADTAGAGVAKRMYFSRCSWNDLAVGFDIRGDVNSDHIRFLDCIIQDHSTDAVFFRADNPQSQNHDFVDCNFETRGIVLEFIAGGNLHVRGCQITVYETGVFLKIGDPAGSGIGIGAGTFNLTDINPEIKDEAKLLEVHAPEARVTLVNPRLVTGLAQTIADWTDGTTYPVDTRVGAGVAGHLTTHSKQQAFKCIQAHTASAVNRPRTGPDWEQYWQPLYEIHINAGAVDIRGGSLALSTIMRYESGAHDRPGRVAS